MALWKDPSVKDPTPGSGEPVAVPAEAAVRAVERPAAPGPVAVETGARSRARATCASRAASRAT